MENKSIEFWLNNFSSVKSGLENNEIKLDFVVSILRRKMSSFDKSILYTLNNVFDENVKNIVFSSRYGEIEKLIKLIAQYKVDNEVSPNLFSGSVHNYGIGFFLMNNKKSINYNAISCGENSISTGFLMTLISKYDNNIYSYADDGCAFALNFSKTKKENSKKYVLTLKNSEAPEVFEEYEKLFLDEKQEIITPLFEIKRQTDD